MPSARQLYLLNQLSIAIPPLPGTLASATSTPWLGTYTSYLLDPAAPLPGTSAAVHEIKYTDASGVAFTRQYLWGRWLTRQLPAQTIAAGNWTIAGNLRSTALPGSASGLTLWGACLAQWRPSTQTVIARLFDSPTAGTSTSPVTGIDRIAQNTIAGGAVTIAANDCLLFELYSQLTANTTAAAAVDLGVLFGGAGQWIAADYAQGAIGDAPFILTAPAAITFS